MTVLLYKKIEGKKIICFQLNCKKNKNYYCTETDRTKCKLLQWWIYNMRLHLKQQPPDVHGMITEHICAARRNQKNNKDIWIGVSNVWSMRMEIEDANDNKGF